MSMFRIMSTLSSAGSTLLIPDCELTDLPSADTFFMKQIAFAMLVPATVLFISFLWVFLWAFCCCCFKQHRQYKDIKLGKSQSSNKDKLGAYIRRMKRNHHIMNNAILTIVLMLFLAFPMLTRLCLAALKCPNIGGKRYLMADLQEPCFEGRHLMYIMFLTIPQIVLYIIGLPALAAGIILRNKHRLDDVDFSIRYGLLYLGYRKDREWWELMVVIRKIAIVSVSTFGTMMRAVDLQAFVALFVVFVSIITHLIGKPFDLASTQSQMLHTLEFGALAICWMTFWGGLLFFLGHENPDVVPRSMRTVTSAFIVISNGAFFVYAIWKFIQAIMQDVRAAKLLEMKEKKRMAAIRKIGTIASSATDQAALETVNASSSVNKTRVLPIDGAADENDRVRSWGEESESEEAHELNFAAKQLKN